MSGLLAERFMGRVLTIQSFAYNPFKGVFRIENASLKTRDGEELASVGRVTVDISLRKLLLLRPTVTSLEVVAPRTYIVQSGLFDFSLPPFIDRQQSDSDIHSDEGSHSDRPRFDWPKIKFSLESLSVTGIELTLRDMTGSTVKKRSLLSEMSLVLPGLTSDREQQLFPRISGLLLGKPVNIKGETAIDNEGLTNTFRVDLRKFNIADIASFIPPLFGVKIIGGIVSTDGSVTLSVSKHRKPQLHIQCSASLNGVRAYDTKLKKMIADNVRGTLKIADYNVFGNELIFSYIRVTGGKIDLSLSQYKKFTSCVFTQPKSNIKFRFGLQSLAVSSVSINIFDHDNAQTFPVYASNLSIDGLSTYSRSDWHIRADMSVQDILGRIQAVGAFNIYDKSLVLDRISMQKISAQNVAFLMKMLPVRMNLILDEWIGRCSISRDEIKLSGHISISAFHWSIQGMVFSADKAAAEVKEFAINRRTEYRCSFDSIVLRGGAANIAPNMKITDANASFRPCSMTYLDRHNSRMVKLDNDLSISNISCRYTDVSDTYLCSVASLAVDKDFVIELGDKKHIGGKSVISSVVLRNSQKVIAGLEQAEIDIDKFDIPSLSLNINRAVVAQPLLTAEVRSDGRLYLIDKIPFGSKDKSASADTDNADKSGKTRSRHFGISIDKTELVDGTVRFVDNSLAKSFSLNVTNISGTMTKFPSFVYPKGRISVSGIVNRRNNVIADADIGAKGMDGYIKTEDMSVSQLSPYFEHYLGYSVSGGNLSLDGRITIDSSRLDSNIGLVLRNLSLVKIKPVFKADLTRLVRVMEDEDHVIKLDIPIRGDMSAPNVDFRRMFFTLFYDMLDNSQSIVAAGTPGHLVRGDTYELLYFTAGSDRYAVSPDTLLSDKIKSDFKKKDKYFILEAYIDRVTETSVLRQTMLKERIIAAAGTEPAVGSADERGALTYIYRSIFGDEPDETLPSDKMRSAILKQLAPDNADYQALSYARLTAMKRLLTDTYGVDGSRIVFEEHHIDDNPYIKGVGNALGVIITAVKN